MCCHVCMGSMHHCDAIATHHRDNTIATHHRDNTSVTQIMTTVTVAAPRVTLTLTAPPFATSGVPFDLAVRAVNHTPLPQSLAFSVGDSHGFLMSGGRSFAVHCLPHAESVAMWRVVAYAAGALRLPEITASVARYSRNVVVTAARGVFVLPATLTAEEASPATSQLSTATVM